MTDTKFTPGPWRRGQTGNLRIYGPDGMGEHSGVVAEVKSKNGHQTANAHLIAAAPDLYEALEEVIAATGYSNGKARAALAKARGEQ